MATVKTNIFAKISSLNLKVNSEESDKIEQIISQFGINLFPINKERILKYLDNWELLDNTATPQIDDIESILQWEMLLQLFARSTSLQLSTDKTNPLLRLIPFSNNFNLYFPAIEKNVLYKLSRFAYFRRNNSSDFIAQTPKGFATVHIIQPKALSMIHTLSHGASIDSLKSKNKGFSEIEISSFIQLLVMSAIIENCKEDGSSVEDNNEILKQWEFHDLLFHSRSRLGRNEDKMGGTFRFKNVINPQPAIKAKIVSKEFFPLAVPDLARLMVYDAPLTSVIELRRSIRAHNQIPISIEQLGHFLYRIARVSSQFKTEIGEFTRRPYPTGGASYELEIYLTVDRCVGLERGFYYYDAVDHGLYLISRPCVDMESLLQEAWVSSAMTCHPQILFSIASRFQRVSWKYEGIAYATQLKNVGVLFGTMYLVATSMRLAPCALGLGNSDRFCKLASTNYFEEGSIGEFMLGSIMTNV